jgi:hypothetical protein
MKDGHPWKTTTTRPRVVPSALPFRHHLSTKTTILLLQRASRNGLLQTLRDRYTRNSRCLRCTCRRFDMDPKHIRGSRSHIGRLRIQEDTDTHSRDCPDQTDVRTDEEAGRYSPGPECRCRRSDSRIHMILPRSPSRSEDSCSCRSDWSSVSPRLDRFHSRPDSCDSTGNRLLPKRSD